MPTTTLLRPGRDDPSREGLRRGTSCLANPRRSAAGRPGRVWLTLFRTAVVAGVLHSWIACRAGEAGLGVDLKQTTLRVGELSVEFRDNSGSPKVLSGVDRLLHVVEAPDFDAFDPNDPGSSAGLNFEHVISGHADPANWFAPRHGTYRLHRGAETNSVVLVRKAEDDPWALASTMTYTVTAPQAIDFEFRCRCHDARRFGQRKYGVLFWANYMNDVDEVALHFRGVTGPGEKEQWLAAEAPAGPPDYVGGGTYRHLAAAPLAYDPDHNLKLNLWSYEYPRFTVPCYYGLAAQGMTLILMFDRGWSAADEIRFSLFKFKVGDRVRRPAWDFQYVIHRVETGKQYGFRGRLIWKKFVSPEDCLREYETWVQSLPVGRVRPAVSDTPRSAPEPVGSGRNEDRLKESGWRLPAQSPVARTTPPLVNYFHLDLPEGRVDHKTERLAQWNVVILNHDLVTRGGISLARMRQTNPRIKILAWIPLQGPNRGLAKGVPPKGNRDWYARKANGTYLVPHWGGNLMNVCTQDHAWLKHVLRYVRQTCLQPGVYDGLMLDCLWPVEPAEHDANSDGVHDARDTAAWQEGMLFLLRRLRTEFPEAILVGNAGGPWPADCPYYEFANGCMHENALGDQAGGAEWRGLWDSYRTALSRVSGRPAYHFLQTDVRADHRTQSAAAGLRMLTENDRRRLRLGLATTLLLDGGYFGFDRGDCLHGQLWWFDEYDVDLGAPLGAFHEGRSGPGTFGREFERGLVVVNPTEAAVPVSNEAGLMDCATGARQKTFLVPPHDAKILLRPGVNVP